MNPPPCAALVFSLLIGASAHAGVTYSFQSTTSGMAEVKLSGDVASDGAKMRVRFTRGDGNVFADDSVAITTDGGKSVSVVDPGAKTFYVMPVADLAAGLGASGLMKASSPQAKVTDAGAGPVMEGFPTRHFVLDVSYDLELGAPSKTHIIMHGETWITGRIPAATADFIGTNAFHTGFPAVDRVIDAQSAALRGGFALKEVMTISAKGGMLDYSTTATATMTNVKVQPVAPSEFLVPAGYARVESPLEKLKAP
jgi:hypothetical protein